jgi:hypothetical protein
MGESKNPWGVEWDIVEKLYRIQFTTAGDL